MTSEETIKELQAELKATQWFLESLLETLRADGGIPVKTHQKKLLEIEARNTTPGTWTVERAGAKKLRNIWKKVPEYGGKPSG